METSLISDRESLISEYVSKITEAHGKFNLQAENAGNALLAGANYRREVGILLEALKNSVDSNGNKVIKHGEWESLFVTAKGKSKSDFTFDFDYNTARNYISFSKKHPEPITHVSQIVREGKDMLIQAGEIDEPDGHAIQTNRDPEGTNWIRALDKVTITFEKIFDTRPLKDWQDSEREVFIQRARPVVARFVEAGGTL